MTSASCPQKFVERSPGWRRPVVYRDSLTVRPHQLSETLAPTTFELQLVKITSIMRVVTLANVYRPPQTSSAAFVDELADVLVAVTAASDRLLVAGDFNCPGPTSGTIHPLLVELFECTDMTQYVQCPTRERNLLDLVAADSSLSITGARVDDAGLVVATLYPSTSIECVLC